MKKAFFVLGCITTIGLARGQTVTPTVYSSNGGFSAQSQGQIQWTIGEPISETYIVGPNVTTMGFHQPELGVVSLIKEQGNDVNVLIYPNPVSNELRIDFSSLNAGTYKLSLHDAIGKLIRDESKEVDGFNSKHVVNLQELAAGEYFLTIRNSAAQFEKTIKVVKVNN